MFLYFTFWGTSQTSRTFLQLQRSFFGRSRTPFVLWRTRDMLRILSAKYVSECGWECLLRGGLGLEHSRLFQTVHTNSIAQGSIKSRCPNKSIIQSRYPALNLKAVFRKVETWSWTTADAGRRLFFRQSFGVSVPTGWIKAFQRRLRSIQKRVGVWTGRVKQVWFQLPSAKKYDNVEVFKHHRYS